MSDPMGAVFAGVRRNRRELEQLDQRHRDAVEVGHQRAWRISRLERRVDDLAYAVRLLTVSVVLLAAVAFIVVVSVMT